MSFVTINAKLSLYGCPACGKHGDFSKSYTGDLIRCRECNTMFTAVWLVKWDGTYTPEMQGTQGPDPLENYDPPLVYGYPMMGDTLGERLQKLQEKVILFREAVVNPDRVTTDEQIEELLGAVFEVSYTLPIPPSLSDEITPPDEVDDPTFEELFEDPYGDGPSSIEEFGAFAVQLQEAVTAGVLTTVEAIKMLEAFGGDEPFETLFPPKGETDGLA